MSGPVTQQMGPCPCGTPRCDAVGTKLTRYGYLVGCTSPEALGRRNRAKGQRAQSRVLKDAARAQGTTMEIAPTHEEQARLLIHYESKQGTQIPKGLRGDTMRHWEEQAANFAHRQTPRRKWALVFTMPGGGRRLFMDFEEFCTLVSEIQELP